MSIKVTAACPVCGQSVSYQHEDSEAWGAISLTDFGIVEIPAHDKGTVVHPHMTGHIEDGSWAEALARHRTSHRRTRVNQQPGGDGLMATFTMELHKALEYDPTIESDVLANYPLFDEGHREELNRKIVNHYWNREIGQETLSLFRHALKRKLDEIMPLYNQHYEISAVKFNQLETIRVNNSNHSTGSTATNAQSSNESNSGAKSRAVAQQLPQTLLSDTGDYATSAQDNVSDTTATSSATDTNTVNQDGTQENTTTGFQGNAALMLLQYRQSLVNVDMMIIEELQNLFMLVWDNGDEFTVNTGQYGYFGLGRTIYN